MDMVERVARALARFAGPHADATWEQYAHEARLAIEAMREPDAITREMVEAARGAVGDDIPGYLSPREFAERIYCAMIDASLS